MGSSGFFRMFSVILFSSCNLTISPKVNSHWPSVVFHAFSDMTASFLSLFLRIPGSSKRRNSCRTGWSESQGSNSLFLEILGVLPETATAVGLRLSAALKISAELTLLGERWSNLPTESIASKGGSVERGLTTVPSPHVTINTPTNSKNCGDHS